MVQDFNGLIQLWQIKTMSNKLIQFQSLIHVIINKFWYTIARFVATEGSSLEQ
jgi:hypothetical protein